MSIPHRGMNNLRMAAILGDLEGAKEFLEQGADPNAPDKQDITPLMWAVNFVDAPIITLMMEHGGDPFLQDKEGQSALSRAEFKNRPDVAALLRAAREDYLAGRKPEKVHETWVRKNGHQVNHIGFFPQTGRKITGIFDFSARKQRVVFQGAAIEGGAHARIVRVDFDDLPPATLRAAMKAFKEQGGDVDEQFILTGKKGQDPQP